MPVTTSTKQKGEVKGVAKKPAPEKFVTVDQFNELAAMMKDVVGIVGELKGKTASPSEVKEEKEISRARPDSSGGTPMPAEWEEKAAEIIGEALDHCEMLQPKGGGTLFTVIIKPEFSNAAPEYLERHGQDRRTKEIGSEGLSGVEFWCKLIRQNLKRPR